MALLLLRYLKQDFTKRMSYVAHDCLEGMPSLILPKNYYNFVIINSFVIVS